MDDMAYEAARAAISEKGDAYFAAHGLADILGELWAEAGPGAILALVRRLAADDVRRFLPPISAGLREAISDDDGFARIVSEVVGKIRPIPFQRPLVDTLAEIGRSRPAAATGAAARLIGLGDADFAAFMIGGAYGGASAECDILIERLLSSEDSTEVAAALRSLKVARSEHGMPASGRIRAAARRALAHDDEEVQKEAMESLLNLCRNCDDAAAEGMIESMVSRYDRSRPILAAHIFADSPFDDGKSLRYLGACMGDRGPEQFTLHSAYCALAKMAGRRPGDVARMLVWMFSKGWTHNALAGAVLDELGRMGAPAAVAAILEALQRPHDGRLDKHLEPAVERIARNAGRGEVAEMVLRAIDDRPSERDPCLRILSLLAREDWRNGGSSEFLEGIMSRLCARPAAPEKEGAEAGGECIPERVEAPALPA